MMDSLVRGSGVVTAARSTRVDRTQEVESRGLRGHGVGSAIGGEDGRGSVALDVPTTMLSRRRATVEGAFPRSSGQYPSSLSCGGKVASRPQ